MPGDPNLLPGRLNVHFAGRYVAGTQLGALNVGEPQAKGVELIPNPDSKDWDGREGVMRWKIEVASSQSESIRMHFFVKYPGDQRTEGL